MPKWITMGRVVVVLLLAVLAIAQQDLKETHCPLCDMDIQPPLNQTIKGNQAIYACEMAGHLDQLRDPASKILRGPVPITSLDVPYTKAQMRCPVCDKAELKFALPWGNRGNQKIFTCSEEHAHMVLENQAAYYEGVLSSSSDEFCTHASVMFDGFQSTVGGTCVKLWFQPWVMNSKVKYAFGFIGIVLLGIFLEWFGEYRETVEDWFIRQYGITETVDIEADTFPKSAMSVLVQAPVTAHSVRSCKVPMWCTIALSGMYMVALAIGYFIMLVAMVYDSGLFVACILGLGIGFFLFKDTEQEEMSGNIDPCCST
ncbi:unnamed protein product [Aphanomyces euteiches]|uniref:Copper transport protein n=1 Tax=Aphanomyces euteiches TaxID=100861 RepID=A0A6G0X8S0_9STRA|nr:hypothetical protein Ae201684_007482 [Aphanomyces euteiches]KAH9100819.1 hypothetical protein Ae201684P_007012 [Aphanomyces euteiches]KAH9143681.1 hypothetical protein AeRB84_012334 [Aphanomyces euteiches]